MLKIGSIEKSEHKGQIGTTIGSIFFKEVDKLEKEEVAEDQYKTWSESDF